MPERVSTQTVRTLKPRPDYKFPIPYLCVNSSLVPLARGLCRFRGSEGTGNGLELLFGERMLLLIYFTNSRLANVCL